MLNDDSLCVPDTRTLLDESVWLFRKNFTLLAAISATMLAPYAALSIVPALSTPAAQLQTSGSLPDFLRMTITSLVRLEQQQGVLGWLYMLVCQPLAAAAIVAAMTERYAQREVDARTSITMTLPSLIQLSVTQILLILLLGVTTLPAIVYGWVVWSIWPSSPWSSLLTLSPPTGITMPMILAGLVGLALLGLPLVVSVRLAFVSQYVMLEQLAPVQSILRSWKLSSGHTGRLLRIVIVVALLELILVKTPAAVLTHGLVMSTNGSEIGWMLGTLITKLSDIVVFPFAIIVHTLLFYSLSLKAMQHDGEQSTPKPPCTLPDDSAAYDATSRIPSA